MVLGLPNQHHFELMRQHVSACCGLVLDLKTGYNYFYYDPVKNISQIIRCEQFLMAVYRDSPAIFAEGPSNT